MSAYVDAIRAVLAPPPGEDALTVHGSPPVGPESLPDEALPYVIVYTPPGVRAAERLAATRSTVTVDFRTVCVALDEEQLEWLCSRVTARLGTRARLTIPGRTCSLITHLGSLPPTPDPDVPGRRLLLGSDSWQFVTSAA